MLPSKNIVFGFHAIIEAIKAGKEIDKVLIKKGSQGELFTQLLSLVKESGVPFQFVPVEKINSITRKNHQGVLAFISPVEYRNIEYLVPQLFDKGRMPLILMLDKMTDVRNFGAISRTAECAGVDAIVIPSRDSVSVTPDAVKASAGALHNLPVSRVFNMKDTLLFLKESGMKVFAATEKAQKCYHQADYTGPVAIVMGAEDTGISPELLKLADELVQIPVRGSIQSLNVSVAAGIILYEVDKQRSASI